MESFFISLLKNSITMSLIALIFIGLNPLLSKKYSAKCIYYGWLIIVIGLIIPFRPHISMNLIHVSSNIQQYIPVESSKTVYNANIVLKNSNMIANTQNLQWYEIVAGIWIIGATVSAVYHSFRHWHFINIIKRWREDIELVQILNVLEELQKEMKITNKVSIKLCPCITSPMMIGFIKPTILLPTTELPIDEISLILRHELIHYKQKDLLYKLFVVIANTIHWFNPISYLIAKVISVQCEIACDEGVIKSLDVRGRKLYAETIIGAIKKQSRYNTILSTNFSGGKKSMKKRIISIMDTKKKKLGIAVIGCIIISSITTEGILAVSTSPVNQQEKIKSSVAISEQKIVNQNEDTYSIYSKYGLTYDKPKNTFLYNGEAVKFFVDKKNEKGEYYFFTRPNGTVNIKAVRNKQNELIGIEVLSKEEYEKLTNGTQNELRGINISKADDKDKGSSKENKEDRDSIDVDKSLNKYLNYGVSYNSNKKQWMLGNKPIRILVDSKNDNYYVNNNIKEGVFVKVARNSNGEIEKLVEISEEELKKTNNLFIKNLFNW